MTAADEQQPVLSGTFWQVETPERRVPGELTLVDGRPSLEVVGQLFVERANTVEFHSSGTPRTIAVGGRADDRVADWEPRNIHGLLGDGTQVSMIGAQGGMKRGKRLVPLEYRQEFRTLRHVILGEHVDDKTTYESCRFQLTGPVWWDFDADSASTADGGNLLVTQVGRERWFEFAPAAALTVREFSRQVLAPIETLASLATTNPTSAVEYYVRIEADSPWLRVYRDEEPATRDAHELLTASTITAEQYVRWTEFRQGSDSLDAAAIDDIRTVAIQTAVLTQAAVAEGLHRRMFKTKTRMPAYSPGELTHARRAARVAALENVRSLDRGAREPLADADLNDLESAMNQALSHLNEMTFVARMTDLLSVAQGAIPNIVAAFANWPAAVKDARNTLAHQLPRPADETLDQFYDRLIALSYSIPWVLRTVLLLHAGFTAEAMRAAYDESSRYEHHVTNTRELLAGSVYAATP